MMLYPVAKDPVSGPSGDENLAVIQAIFGENSRAIAALTQLLQTPYYSLHYGPAPITPALLNSIRSGTHCVPIPLSKNSARKRSRELPEVSPS